jgi:hypothetical protein
MLSMLHIHMYISLKMWLVPLKGLPQIDPSIQFPTDAAAAFWINVKIIFQRKLKFLVTEYYKFFYQTVKRPTLLKRMR